MDVSGVGQRPHVVGVRDGVVALVQMLHAHPIQAPTRGGLHPDRTPRPRWRDCRPRESATTTRSPGCQQARSACLTLRTEHVLYQPPMYTRRTRRGQGMCPALRLLQCRPDLRGQVNSRMICSARWPTSLDVYVSEPSREGRVRCLTWRWMAATTCCRSAGSRPVTSAMVRRPRCAPQ